MRRARPGERAAQQIRDQIEDAARHVSDDGDKDRVLTQDEIAERLGLTVEHLRQLDQIAAGRPPRNAKTVLDAIRLRLEWAYSKPPQRVEVDVVSERLEQAIARLRAAGVAATEDAGGQPE